MKTREQIIAELLEKKAITTDEAAILLATHQTYILNPAPMYPIPMWPLPNTNPWWWSPTYCNTAASNNTKILN